MRFQLLRKQNQGGERMSILHKVTSYSTNEIGRTAYILYESDVLAFFACILLIVIILNYYFKPLFEVIKAVEK